MSTDKDEIRELTETLSEFHRVLESKNHESSEIKEKLEKIEKDLDKKEDANQKLVKMMADSEKANKDLNDTLSVMERQINRMSIGSSGYVEKSEEIKNFENVIRTGNMDLAKKYLRTDNDPAGGYLAAPPEYIVQLIKKITEISPIRSISKVLQTNRQGVILPTREQILTATWAGEGQLQTATQSTYGQNEIKVNTMRTVVPYTIEEMTDSAFNVDELVTQDFAEAFAKAEGLAFVTGNGVNKPFGFTNNTSIQQVPTGVLGGFTGDSFITIQGELKVGYSPVWVMNRRTLSQVRRLKTSIGQYLWIPGLAAGMPNQIDGFPYISAIDMPDVTDGVSTTPVAFGDFTRGYCVVDNISLNVIRDNTTLADQGMVRLIANRRVGGQVILAEAIKLMVTSVS